LPAGSTAKPWTVSLVGPPKCLTHAAGRSQSSGGPTGSPPVPLVGSPDAPALVGSPDAPALVGSPDAPVLVDAPSVVAGSAPIFGAQAIAHSKTADRERGIGITSG
jgi:hypothetical protein